MITKSEARRLLSTAGEDGLVEAIRVVLRSYGHEGRWLTVSQVAELAEMSVRSFQRKLHEQDAAFSELVDRTREELATELLRKTDASLSDIATHLGYTNHANFSRAYQRWTGLTPSEMRDS